MSWKLSGTVMHLAGATCLVGAIGLVTVGRGGRSLAQDTIV